MVAGLGSPGPGYAALVGATFIVCHPHCLIIFTVFFFVIFIGISPFMFL